MFAAADMSMPSKLLLHYGTVGLIACGMSISASLVCVRIANFKEFDLKLKLFVVSALGVLVSGYCALMCFLTCVATTSIWLLVVVLCIITIHLQRKRRYLGTAMSEASTWDRFKGLAPPLFIMLHVSVLSVGLAYLLTPFMLAGFAMTASLTACFYLATAFTSPGSVPDSSDFRDIAGKSIRTCKHCQHLKPDRAHHCRKCQSCILKMDHHCPWLATCIGIRNHRFFMWTLIYAVSTLVISMSTLPAGFRKVSAFRSPWQASPIVIVWTMFSSVFLYGLLFGFLSLHLYLIAKNLTTIEFFEKSKSLKARHLEAHSSRRQPICSQDFCKNMFAVLSYNPLYWLLPLHPPSIQEAVHCSFDAAV